MGLSVAWQRTHSPGTSAERSDAAFAEPCGSWQVVQACATGGCLNFALAAWSETFAWQPAHSSAAGFARLNLFAEACGWWHATQPFSAMGRCVLFASAGTTAGWQRTQVFPGSSARSLP